MFFDEEKQFEPSPLNSLHFASGSNRNGRF